LADSIAGAFDKLKDATKSSLSTVFLSLSGTHITGQNAMGLFTLLEKNSEITRKDLQKCISQANAGTVTYDTDILHNIIISYAVDSQGEIENPVGMFGNKLETNCYIVTGKTLAIQNVLKAINYAGFEVEELVWSGLANGFACLSDYEKQMGAVLIEIGASLTNIAIFSDGKLRLARVLPIGSNGWTEEISKRLRVPFDIASKLKQRYGGIYDRELHNLKLQEVVAIPNLSKEKVTRKEILDALEPSVNSLLFEIQQILSTNDNAKYASNGAVITGGGALLEGFAEKAEAAFNMPVRIGTSKNVKTQDLSLNTPACSAALGLVNYGFKKIRQPKLGKTYKNPFMKAYFNLKDFLADYF